MKKEEKLKALKNRHTSLTTVFFGHFNGKSKVNPGVRDIEPKSLSLKVKIYFGVIELIDKIEWFFDSIQWMNVKRSAHTHFTRANQLRAQPNIINKIESLINLCSFRSNKLLYRPANDSASITSVNTYEIIRFDQWLCVSKWIERLTRIVS